MKISSTAFKENELIAKKYTCDGEGISPPITIENIPRDTKSLALIVRDPDAPSGDFVHWLVWNIPPDTEEFKEGKIPKGETREGVNDADEIGWIPPCPPEGKHRYEFNLYALDSNIDLPVMSNKIDLLSKIQGSLIEEAQIVGVYEKNK